MLIRTRLKAILLTTIILSIIMFGVLITSNIIISNIALQGQSTSRLTLNVADLIVLNYEYSTTPNKRALQQWDITHKHILDNIGALEQTKDIQPLLKKMHKRTTNIQQIFNRIKTIPHDSKLSKNLLNHLIIESQSLQNEASKINMLNLNLLSHYNRTVFITLISLTIIYLFVISFVTIHLNRRIAIPFQELQYGANKIGEGNLSHTINIRTNDEFESLSNTLNHMSKKLSTSTVNISDLQKEVTRQTRQLSIALKEAQTANQQKNKFLANISHELRTPMTAIIGFSQLISTSPELNEESKDNISEINKASEHLMGLINDLLNISRIESGKFVVDISQCELANILQDCITATKHFADENHIHIENKCEFEHIPIQTDKLRLKQVIINILTNAIKYNHKGGTVKIECKHTIDKQTMLMISDRGIGMTPEELENIFTPFYRADKLSTRVEGLGVGLSISKVIMEKLNGDLIASSIVNEGTTFTIIINS